ncbi:MAG: DUF2225 domain-containing protein [Deferribacteraceae bacterium]|jgi:CRP-like cAMP-binding protein/uncharacterized protein (DUF2225 family)|nr:DUF2225 domain-containing protein [Deferribacteraceae bacterium]
MNDIENLLKIAKVEQFSPNEIIAEEGANPDSMFILLKGCAGVYKNYGKNNEKQLEVLNTGAFFGEMSLFLGNKRLDTVVAESDAVVLTIERINARQVFAAEPDITLFIMETLFARLNYILAECEERAAKLGTTPKPPLKEYVFKVNNPKGDCLYSYKKGETLSRGKAQNLYFILNGKAQLYFNYGKAGEFPLGWFTTGNFFGESILGSIAAVAAEDTLILVLNNRTAHKFFANEPEATFRIIETTCDRLDILHNHYEAFFANKLTTDGYRSHILFPDGHKVYEGGINRKCKLLFERYHSCPICKKKFVAACVREKDLTLISSDEDFRPHYNEVDPLHYSALTCPQCWFSAPEEYFTSAYYTRTIFEEKLAPYKLQMKYSFQQDVNSVFNSYYLASVCAPLCYTTNAPLVMGHIWQRIAWLYDDCNDPAMRDMALRYSLNYFNSAYATGIIPAKQLHHTMIVIGVQNFRLGRYYEALAILDKTINLKGISESNRLKTSEILKKYRDSKQND